MGIYDQSSQGSPMVSVCMPVYNGAWCVQEAVASVLAQTFRDFELLVFDDGSTDDSWALLESFKDPRIRLRRNAQNLGTEGNWNQALRAAGGKYIKLFHQDDLLEPDGLRSQVEALERHPEAVLAFCGRKIIRADGKVLLRRRGAWNGLVGAAELLRRCAMAGTNLVGEPSAVLFRNTVARETGGFDGSIPYLIDLDYWARLMIHGPAFASKDTLVSFRVSARQWSARIGWRQGADFSLFLDRTRERGILGCGPLLKAWGGAMARFNGFMRMLIYRFMGGEG